MYFQWRVRRFLFLLEVRSHWIFFYFLITYRVCKKATRVKISTLRVTCAHSILLEVAYVAISTLLRDSSRFRLLLALSLDSFRALINPRVPRQTPPPPLLARWFLLCSHGYFYYVLKSSDKNPRKLDKNPRTSIKVFAGIIVRLEKTFFLLT